MLNDKIELLGTHPFPRISKLLNQAAPSASHEPIDLTIGEPQFIPDKIRGLLARAAVSEEDYRKYPPNQPVQKLKNRHELIRRDLFAY